MITPDDPIHPPPQSPECPGLAELDVPGPLSPGVEAHIAACGACRDRLREVRENNAFLDSFSSDLDPAPAAKADPLVTLRGYTIERELHRGGQGVVFDAHQHGTNRHVAVKTLLRGALATTRQQLRFEREVELSSMLRHPGIVSVYETGRTDDGRQYLVMEYVEGPTLGEWAAEAGAPDPAIVVDLVAQICDAVHHAHQRGVLHRDLKPQNIIVESRGVPRVLDFGLAIEADAHARRLMQVTDDGAVLGTLAYAAPEQTRGDLSAIDVRTDVYAIGVMLYELLAGGPPFVPTGDVAAFLAAIQEHAPPPLRHLSRDLETIVLRAMAKEPGRRYQSAADLGEDLRRFQRGEAVEARRDHTGYVLRKAIVRHRGKIGALAALVVVLLTGTVVSWMMYRRTLDERSKLQAVNLFLEDTLGSVAATTPGLPVTVRALLDEGGHWVDLVLQDQPDVEIEVRRILANGYGNLGRLDEDRDAAFDAAEAHLVRARELATAQFGADDLRLARISSQIALLRFLQGRYDESLAMHRDVYQSRERQLGSDHRDTIITLANIARVQEQSGNLVDAEATLREVLRRRELQQVEYPGDVALTQYRLAELLRARGRADEAAALHRGALAIREKFLRSDHPDRRRSEAAVAALATPP